MRRGFYISLIWFVYYFRMDDFDLWIEQKRRLNDKNSFFRLKEREVWWCAYGHNVGVEMNGKGDTFQRPVIILKVFNSEMVFVLPLSSEEGNSKYYISCILKNEKRWVVLSQGRLISSRRLLRRLGKMKQEPFTVLKESFRNMY